MKRETLSAFCLFLPHVLPAAELGEVGNPLTTRFGAASAAAGSQALVGAPEATGPASRGAAYYFNNALSTIGLLTPTKILSKSDGLASDRLGDSASLRGFSALVGAPMHDTSGPSTENQGAAYLYRNLNATVETINQTAKLVPGSSGAGHRFGTAVALDPSATCGVVSAPGVNLLGTGIDRGLVYTFLNLNTATGTVNESALLYVPDGAANDKLGASLAAWNFHALAGAPGDDTSATTEHGAAYLWRNFTSASGLVGQNVKLTASDKANGDDFGRAVALSGNTGISATYALAGAPGDNIGAVSDQGSAYFYNLGDAASGEVTQTAKLVASTGGTDHLFGSSVAISGLSALVGSPGSLPGYAYLFTNLGSASGTVNETLRLASADAVLQNAFGASVAIDGDTIMVGSPHVLLNPNQLGRAFTGRVSDLITLNIGSVTREVDRIKVRSRTNWIIGDTQDNITLTLGQTGVMELVTAGTGIRIGNTNTADNNLLVVAGAVTGTPAVTVGTGTNTGNQLRVNGGMTANGVTVHSGSILSGSGSITGTVTVTGSVRPGISGIEVFQVVGDFTWNAGTAWQFDTGSSNSSDRLAITGATSDFLKGTSTSLRVFDFGGSSQTGTFTLVQWGGTTTFTAADFAATGLGGGLSAAFAIVGKTLQVTTSALTPLQAWRQTHFGSTANSGNGADDFDFDKDGVPNVLEYALGTLPTNPASRQIPVLGQSANRLTLKFTPQVTAGLTYKIQTSPNLTTWSETTPAGLSPGVLHTWTDTVVISTAPPGRRFARLAVTSP